MPLIGSLVDMLVGKKKKEMKKKKKKGKRLESSDLEMIEGLAQRGRRKK